MPMSWASKLSIHPEQPTIRPFICHALSLFHPPDRPLNSAPTHSPNFSTCLTIYPASDILILPSSRPPVHLTNDYGRPVACRVLGHQHEDNKPPLEGNSA